MIPRLAIIIRERALAAAADPPTFFHCLYSILMKLYYNLVIGDSLGDDCVTSAL